MSPRAQTILMIDDDAQHLHMQSLILNQAGFRIITVVVGMASFSLPESDHPGLIFLDYQLNSSLTSAQVSGLLRETFPDVPVVLLSSASSMPEGMAGLVDGFISKSDPEELVSFARRFFDGKQATTAKRSSS